MLQWDFLHACISNKNTTCLITVGSDVWLVGWFVGTVNFNKIKKPMILIAHLHQDHVNRAPNADQAARMYTRFDYSKVK